MRGTPIDKGGLPLCHKVRVYRQEVVGRAIKRDVLVKGWCSCDSGEEADLGICV